MVTESEGWEIPQAQGYQVFMPQEMGAFAGFEDPKWQFSKSLHMPYHLSSYDVGV